MSALIEIDIKLFFFLNRSIANPVFDIIMPFVTDLDNWKIPILIVWMFLMIRGGKKGRIVGILLIFVLISTDQLSSSLIKPLVGRIRPCHTLNDVRLLVGCGGKLAFPSSHATNISGVAVLFSFFYRRGTVWFTITALIVGFSRIYVGVHYPADVAGGFLFGSASGGLIVYFYLKISEFYSSLDYRTLQSSVSPNNREELKNPSGNYKSR
ncbi:MAG: phosphatase PAP2 family protein [Calditrichaeota bacterium]|nr:phosphatase PAP2 family protein [Calditrichota bacterium]RQW08141.1 MAG: phosphatase PAP2 family protein [Calditrichota bacterium]